MGGDPLGLTPEQRVTSNMFAAFSQREIWWPPDADPRVIDGEWTEACPSCRAISGHAPDCMTLFAEQLDQLQLELAMRVVPKELAATPSDQGLRVNRRSHTEAGEDRG